MNNRYRVTEGVAIESSSHGVVVKDRLLRQASPEMKLLQLVRQRRPRLHTYLDLLEVRNRAFEIPSIILQAVECKLHVQSRSWNKLRDQRALWIRLLREHSQHKTFEESLMREDALCCQAWLELLLT